MSDARVFTYRIDASDVILHVSPEWVEFALENEANELVLPGVVGKALWPFIADGDTRHLYRVILEKVRSARAVMCFSYRCDAPHMRRYMEMVVRPWDAKGVEFNSRIVREVPRTSIPLLSPTAARSDEMIRMCSWCKRVAIPEWLEVEEAIQRLRPFEKDYLPQITHGICGDCQKQMLRTVA
jgi:hypothetical protein